MVTAAASSAAVLPTPVQSFDHVYRYNVNNL